MSTALQMISETWMVLAAMAPYLLLGFLLAGVLSVAVSTEFVERHLGRRGLWQVVKASLLGVPLPLCSCSVLPVSASLRKHGASKGATMSFLVSTPQTGVDSIMATWALLGPLVTVFRVATAFISGVAAGWLSDLFGSPNGSEGNGKKDSPCACGHKGHMILRALRYGFVTLPSEIGRAVLLGAVLSGILGALVPHDFFAGKIGSGFVSMLVAMAIGIPMYVCSTGSIPIAFAMLRMGLSPGAALVFLVTGPATNAASLTTIWKVLGRRELAIYLATIVVCALGAGLLLDFVISGPLADAGLHMAHEAAAGWREHASGVLLLAVLLPSLAPKAWKRAPRVPAEGTCCSGR